MTRNKRKPFFPIVLLFILFNSLFIAGKNWLKKWNADTDVLIVGNLILFIATVVSFFLYTRALKNDKPHKFLKYIYGGMFLKMLICLAAALVYIFALDGKVNKPALFGCMFLYFLYTFVEVSILLRLSKQQKNVQTGSSS